MTSRTISSVSLLSVVFIVTMYELSPYAVPAIRAPTHPTTRPRPSNSLLRRRHRRATANLLVRGRPGAGGGMSAAPPPARPAGDYQKISYKGRATFTGRRRSFLPGNGLQIAPVAGRLAQLVSLAGRPGRSQNGPT